MDTRYGEYLPGLLNALAGLAVLLVGSLVDTPFPLPKEMRR